MFLLEVLGDTWRIMKMPIESTRPFVFESVALREQGDVRAEDPDTIVAFLEHKVGGGGRKGERVTEGGGEPRARVTE